MMSWWKNNKEQKEKKQRQQEQMKMLQNIATLTRFAKAGLLFIDIPQKKVVISTTLSSLFLTDRTKWMNFLQNLQLWFVYKVSQLNWNQYFLEVEVKAVREARQKHPNLTKLQEVDIRHKARAEVNIEAVPVPKIEPYEFILSTDIKHGEEPEIFAVGRWENGAFEMVTFEDVQNHANQK
jgi:hypothetical protein